MQTIIKSLLSFGKQPKKPTAKTVRKPKGLAARITAAGDRLAFAWPVREALYRHLSAQVGNGVTVELALHTFRARLQRNRVAGGISPPAPTPPSMRVRTRRFP